VSDGIFIYFSLYLSQGRGGTWRQKWERLKAGESNGKLPLRTCQGCSVPEPYRSPNWALVPAQTGPKAEY
jgi:hypothetical protein